MRPAGASACQLAAVPSPKVAKPADPIWDSIEWTNTMQNCQRGYEIGFVSESGAFGRFGKPCRSDDCPSCGPRRLAATMMRLWHFLNQESVVFLFEYVDGHPRTQTLLERVRRARGSYALVKRIEGMHLLASTIWPAEEAAARMRPCVAIHRLIDSVSVPGVVRVSSSKGWPLERTALQRGGGRRISYESTAVWERASRDYQERLDASMEQSLQDGQDLAAKIEEIKRSLTRARVHSNRERSRGRTEQ